MSDRSRTTLSSTGSSRLSAFRVMKEVFRLVPSVRMVTISMIVIGLIAGLAEAIGITFLVSLVSLLYAGSTDSEFDTWIPHLLRFTGLENSPAILAWILSLTFLAQLGLTLINGTLGNIASNRISESTRRRLHEQLLDMSFEDIGQRDRGELMTILTGESYMLASAHYSIVRIGVNLGTMAIFGLALIGTAWQVAAVAIVTGVIHSGVMRLFSRQFQEVGTASSEATEELTRLSWGILQARKSVRTYGVQRRKHQEFQKYSKLVTQTATHSTNLDNITSTLSQIMVFVIVLGVIWLSQKLGLAFPTVMTAAVLLYRLQPHIREFDWSLLRLLEAETPISRIAALLDRDDKIYIQTGSQNIQSVEKEIRFEDVTYRYPGTNRPSIVGISFPIAAHQSTAIIGPSGVGKTTVINLLLRLATPTQGKVTVDGMDLMQITKEDWSKVIAVAGQDVELIEGTIRENITFFRDFTEEEIDWAAQLSGLNEFVPDLAYGYDEWVGDEAMQLSGGQRQRLGLARALIGRPDILLLDEATSALDEELEESVLQNVLREFSGKTVILITHRPKISGMVENVVTLSRTGARAVRSPVAAD